MSAASTPRLSGGIVASVLLHGGLIAAFFALRAPPPPSTPPLYQVRLFAAPPGERAIGVVQPPQPKPETPAPTPAATKAPARPTPVPPKAKPKPTTAPKAATPVAPTKTAEQPKTTAPAPTAGGGPTGGKGADVANVQTPGIEFPYPYYTNNIVRQLILQFGQASVRYSAEVRFVIRRDGSVDPESIHLVTSSGNYSFDQRALGAVEAAANAKVFGPLPPGFREDILPVNFRFSPTLIR